LPPSTDANFTKLILPHSPKKIQSTRRTPTTVAITRMSGNEEYDEATNADDGGMTGPGAPTPLSALEVSTECWARVFSK
jgi:hypothetical protein